MTWLNRTLRFISWSDNKKTVDSGRRYYKLYAMSAPSLISSVAEFPGLVLFSMVSSTIGVPNLAHSYDPVFLFFLPLASASAVAIKLPPFWTENSDAWFQQTSVQFALCNIMSEETKYFYLLANLNSIATVHVTLMLDPIDSSSRYSGLKFWILLVFLRMRAQQFFNSIDQMTFRGCGFPYNRLHAGERPMFLLHSAFDYKVRHNALSSVLFLCIRLLLSILLHLFVVLALMILLFLLFL